MYCLRFHSIERFWKESLKYMYLFILKTNYKKIIRRLLSQCKIYHFPANLFTTILFWKSPTKPHSTAKLKKRKKLLPTFYVNAPPYLSIDISHLGITINHIIHKLENIAAKEFMEQRNFLNSSRWVWQAAVSYHHFI